MKIGRQAVAWLLPLLLVVPMTGAPAWAQDNGPAPGAAQDNGPPPSAAQGPAQGTIPPSAFNPDTSGNYTQQQLDQMLAPIALYPDKLLMNILMASTFPDQLQQVQGWLKQPGNSGLKGDALLNALKAQQWDPSVKAIVQFPQIVDLLTKDPQWTQGLGAAFDNQQDDVLAQVQFLRQQAQKSGHLKSNDKMVVQNDGPNIVIAPAVPNVVYAPYYDPAVVYGPWPWVAYPPVWFPPAYFGIGPLAIGVGWGWGPAWYIAPPLWGWYSVGWGYGGGIFFHAGFGPAFGWYGHGWYGGGWRGGGWRHGGGGHWGHPGYHGHYGFRGAGPGGRAGAGARAGRANGAFHGPRAGGNRGGAVHGPRAGGINHRAGAVHGPRAGFNRGAVHGPRNGGMNRGGVNRGINRGGAVHGPRGGGFNRGAAMRGPRAGGMNRGAVNRGGGGRGGGGRGGGGGGQRHH